MSHKGPKQPYGMMIVILILLLLFAYFYIVYLYVLNYLIHRLVSDYVAH